MKYAVRPFYLQLEVYPSFPISHVLSATCREAGRMAVNVVLIMNTSLSTPFSPYVNDLYFLHGAFIFEDAGVAAYKGALATF